MAITQGLHIPRWAAYPIFLLALLLVIGGYIVRGEDFGLLLMGFASIAWFAQASGTLLLYLLEGRVGSRLRFLLVGHALGLALIPILYVVLRTVGLEQHYSMAHSLMNLVFAAMIVFVRRRAIGDGSLRAPIATETLRAVAILCVAVAGSVLLRELLLFHPGRLIVSSSQEVDAGYFIGMITGLRDFGSLVDMNSGGSPMHYHYFIILFMALVSGTSGASALTVFQAIFPVYLFLLLAVSAFWATRQIGGSIRGGLLGGILILVLNDLSVINTALGVITRSETLAFFYATLNVANLHLSPSWLVSIGMLMILMGELRRIQGKEKVRLADFIPFLLVISVMAGYKVPTWMCLAGGMGLASLLLVRRQPVFLIASILAVAGGSIVLLGFIGVSTAQSALGEIYIGYLLLNNDGVKQLAGIADYKVTIDTITPGIIGLIVLLMPIWLLLTYGVRIIWLASSVRRLGALNREGNYLEMSILFGILFGVIVTVVIVPSSTPWIVYYYSLFGLVASTPFTAVILYGYLQRWRGIRRVALVGLVGMQMASGIMYIVKPLVQKKNIANLGGEWLEAMNYLRRNTEPGAVLASNRFGFSTDPAYSDYNERFYFVPAFAERIVAVSGSKYYLATNPLFHRRRQISDSLFQAPDPAGMYALADALDVDYIVFDSWQGDSLQAADPPYFNKVYSNRQIDIYRVRPDPAVPPAGDSIINRVQ